MVLVSVLSVFNLDDFIYHSKILSNSFSLNIIVYYLNILCINRTDVVLYVNDLYIIVLIMNG